MEITLEGKGARGALLIAALAIALFFSYQGVRLWVADYRINSNRLALIERGAALEPGNAEAWDILGRFRQLDFDAGDPNEAIKDFQRALHDDPLSSYYWMNLAAAYEAAGNDSDAQKAFEDAQAVYPLSALVAWNYGNFLLREQRWTEGYAQIQLAVRTDSTLLPLAISRTWRSNQDVDTLLNQVLPVDVNAYLQALDFFASIHEAEPGLRVWQRLIALRKPIALPLSFSFLDELIRADRSEDASRVWREALDAAGLAHEGLGNESLMWDGNFTGDFTNGGLGWRWNNPLGATIDFDSAPPGHSGRSVRVDFGGGSNLELQYPLEYVSVEPNRTYHFLANLRTEAISTESGMRFSIADPNHSGIPALETENLTGDHAWTLAELDVPTGAQTHFLTVRLYRNKSRLFENKLSGTAWIADLTLVPTRADAGRSQQ
ncbi:MAG TPA: tetratricopeptide repeat protein [Candidatus Acidoferrales bacterium]|nr:tetratricopeptide repeat protein [Candidatus Acidoferrales bacterium]